MCVGLSPAGDATMQDNYAPCKYVHTRVTYYYASVLDLRWSRAIHSCDSCGFLPQLRKPGQKLCDAVHYGICSPIKLAPTSLPAPLPTNGPKTPLSPPKTPLSPPKTPLSPPTTISPGVVTVTSSTPIVTPSSPPQSPGGSVVITTIAGPQISAPVPETINLVTAQQVIKDKDSVNREQEAVISNNKRGEPDGEANTFLRQKEAQLREKREREQREKNDVSKKVTGTGDAPLEAKGVKKKDGLIAAAISSLKNQNTAQPTPSSQRVKVVPALENDKKEATENAVSATQSQKQQQPQPQAAQKQAEKGGQKPGISAKPSQQPQQPAQPLPTQQQPEQPQQGVSNNLKSAAQKAPSEKTVSRASNGLGASAVLIPQFYFPLGRPKGSDDGVEATAQKIKEVFVKAEGGKIQKQDSGTLSKACGFPFYWKCPLFVYAGGEKNGYVTLQSFLAAWKKLVTSCHDDVARFMRIMATSSKTYLEEDDFLPLIQDVVDTHPGLSFLQDAPEFHSRYVQTVISRIFYCVNRSWSGKITTSELRKSDFIQTLTVLEDEEDINQVTDFFSYEHFYVIYCKFWELDKDHDLYISREDLSRHNDHALSLRMIDRIFSGAVTRNLSDNKMVYKDFVWFLISEEDKRHPTSVEYWFRCMDLDGDGVISMYEMEYFYEEQVQKMEALGIETLPFEDCLCQMLDMIRPSRQGSVSLQDLKACKLTPIFFDTFFNLEKYLEHEQKDPFANLRDHDGEDAEMSDWERYAAEEYEILVAEEGANEEINYEDDFEPEEDLLSPTNRSQDDEVTRLSDPPQKRKPGSAGGGESTDENIYDYTNNRDNIGY